MNLLSDLNKSHTYSMFAGSGITNSNANAINHMDEKTSIYFAKNK